jgi:hypothetical protein
MPISDNDNTDNANRQYADFDNRQYTLTVNDSLALEVQAWTDTARP